MIPLTPKQKREIFDRMDPDLVAYGCNTLHIGEITSSGYYGKNGKDFHIGATRKLGEAFTKLYIYKKEISTIIKRLKPHLGSDDIESVEYHFIVPEGSRFIRDLGYRARIFTDDFVKLSFFDPNLKFLNRFHLRSLRRQQYAHLVLLTGPTQEQYEFAAEFLVSRRFLTIQQTGLSKR